MYSKRMGDELPKLHKSERKFKVPYNHNLPLNFEDGLITYKRPYRITSEGNYVIGYSEIDDALCGNLVTRGDISVNKFGEEISGFVPYSGTMHELFNDYKCKDGFCKTFSNFKQKCKIYDLPVVREIEFEKDQIMFDASQNNLYNTSFEKLQGSNILKFPDIDNLVELNSSVMVKQNFFPKTRTDKWVKTGFVRIKYIFKYDHVSDNFVSNNKESLDNFNEKGSIELIAEINLDEHTRLSHIGIVGEIPKFKTVCGKCRFDKICDCYPDWIIQKNINVIDVNNTGYVTEFDLYVSVNKKWQFIKTFEGCTEPLNIKMIPFTWENDNKSSVIKIKIVPTKYIVRPMMRVNFYGTSKCEQNKKSKNTRQRETLIGTNVKYFVKKTITASHEKLKPRGCRHKGQKCNKIYNIHPNKIRSQEQRRAHAELINEEIYNAYDEDYDYNGDDPRCVFEDEYQYNNYFEFSSESEYDEDTEDEYDGEYERHYEMWENAFNKCITNNTQEKSINKIVNDLDDDLYDDYYVITSCNELEDEYEVI